VNFEGVFLFQSLPPDIEQYGGGSSSWYYKLRAFGWGEREMEDSHGKKERKEGDGSPRFFLLLLRRRTTAKKRGTGQGP